MVNLVGEVVIKTSDNSEHIVEKQDEKYIYFTGTKGFTYEAFKLGSIRAKNDELNKKVIDWYEEKTKEIVKNSIEKAIEKDETKYDLGENRARSTRKLIANAGDVIYAGTNAEFLNKLLGLNYKQYMKCAYNYSDNLVILFIESGYNKSTQWKNHFSSEKIIMEYLGNAEDMLEGHKSFDYKNLALFEKRNYGNGKEFYFWGIYKPSHLTIKRREYVKLKDEFCLGDVKNN